MAKTTRKSRQTDEQATWNAFVRETGEVMFCGSFDACQRFYRMGKMHLVIRRADKQPHHRAASVQS